MDSTGTLAMAQAFYPHGMLTCLHKFYTNEQLDEAKKSDFYKNCMVTTGVVDEETLRKLPVENFLWYDESKSLEWVECCSDTDVCM
jgi:hypothetical protein